MKTAEELAQSPMVIVNPSVHEEHIRALTLRIEELEDILSELLPVAEAYDVQITANFKTRSEAEAKTKQTEWARDTLHIDQHVFRRIKRALANRPIQWV